MKNIKLYRESSSGNYLGTLTIGEDYLERWEKLSLPFWIPYCNQHDLGLFALTRPYDDIGNKRVDWQKLLIGKALKDNRISASGVCFIDYDVIPNPYADNIFSHKDIDTIGFVSQRNNLPYGEISSLLKKIVFHRHRVSNGRYPLDSYITAPLDQVFKDHDLTTKADFGCGGLFLFNHDLHSEFFESVFNMYSNNSKLVANPGEQVHLNWHIQSRDDVQWLDYKWHTLWWFEMAENYPWLYYRENRDQNVARIILAVLSKCNFLHFVGSWEKWAWTFLELISPTDIANLMNSIRVEGIIGATSQSRGLFFPDNDEELGLISR
jgi:hypothetical protein